MTQSDRDLNPDAPCARCGKVTSSRPSTVTDHEGAVDFCVLLDGRAAEATLLPCECCSGRIHGLVTWGGDMSLWLDSPGVQAVRKIAGRHEERLAELCGEIEAACNQAQESR